MKTAILEIYNSKKLSKNFSVRIDAHLRNSFRLKKLLEADLLVCEDDYLYALAFKYDCLILGYASHYAPFRLITKFLNVNKSAIKIILSNEYNICPFIGGFSPAYLITNYEVIKPTKSIIKHYFNNLNVLIYDSAEIIKKTLKKYDCVYYGTFRPGRNKYFKEYLQNEMYLSTSSKNFKKFIACGCHCKFVDKFKWFSGNETLRLFRYSLYIEDDVTHVNYNCLANRFYEAVMCSVVIFFDIDCKRTVVKSGLKIDDFFYVNSKKDLSNKISASTYDDLIAKQRNFIDYCLHDKVTSERKLLDIIRDIYDDRFVGRLQND